MRKPTARSVPTRSPCRRRPRTIPSSCSGSGSRASKIRAPSGTSTTWWSPENDHACNASGALRPHADFLHDSTASLTRRLGAPSGSVGDTDPEVFMKSRFLGPRRFLMALPVLVSACARPVGPVASGSAREPQVASLFDGRSLAGWEGDPALWRVEDGAIVGRIPESLGRNEFLVSSRVLRDFRMRVEVKLATDRNNSGIQFRSRTVRGKEGHSHVEGYQADIGGPDGVLWGDLYDESYSGRGLLAKSTCQSQVKANDWNSYEILAVGSRVRLTLNGHPCVDLDDPQGAREGIVAVQLHKGGAAE